jgi:hypothetical protein
VSALYVSIYIYILYAFRTVQIISPRRRADGSLSSIVFILFYMCVCVCVCVCYFFQFRKQSDRVVLVTLVAAAGCGVAAMVFFPSLICFTFILFYHIYVYIFLLLFSSLPSLFNRFTTSHRRQDPASVTLVAHKVWNRWNHRHHTADRTEPDAATENFYLFIIIFTSALQ